MRNKFKIMLITTQTFVLAASITHAAVDLKSLPTVTKCNFKEIPESVRYRNHGWKAQISGSYIQGEMAQKKFEALDGKKEIFSDLFGGDYFESRTKTTNAGSINHMTSPEIPRSDSESENLRLNVYCVKDEAQVRCIDYCDYSWTFIGYGS